MLSAWWLTASQFAPAVSPLVLLPLALLHVLAASAAGLDNQLRYVGWSLLSRRVVTVWGRDAIGLALLGFLWPELAPRGPAVAFALAHLAMLLAVRIGTMGVRRFVRERGRNLRYLVVAGTGTDAVRAAHAFTDDAGYGMRLVGFLGDDDPLGLPAPVLGTFSDLERLVRSHVIDEVLVADPSASVAQIEGLCRACNTLGLRTHLTSSFVPGAWRGVDAREVGGEEVLSLTPFPHGTVGLSCKRVVDVVLAAVLLVVFLPLLLGIALAIKLDSKGPVFFVQWRIGLNGRRFRFPKFRSMVSDAEARLHEVLPNNEMNGPVFKMKADPRITRVGAILRRLSLDELPQLWCVLNGDMSLVGPRPLMPHEVLGHESWQRRRLSMRPGLTCLWQISGRNHVDFEQWMRLDLEYIDDWSLLLDLRILLRTVPAVLSGRGAS